MVKGSVASCVCVLLAASSVSAFNGPSMRSSSMCTRVTSRNAMTMRWGLEAKGVANKVRLSRILAIANGHYYKNSC